MALTFRGARSPAEVKWMGPALHAPRGGRGDGRRTCRQQTEISHRPTRRRASTADSSAAWESPPRLDRDLPPLTPTGTAQGHGLRVGWTSCCRAFLLARRPAAPDPVCRLWPLHRPGAKDKDERLVPEMAR